MPPRAPSQKNVDYVSYVDAFFSFISTFFLFRGSSTYAVRALPLCSQSFVLWDRYQPSPFCFVIVNYIDSLSKRETTLLVPQASATIKPGSLVGGSLRESGVMFGDFW